MKKTILCMPLAFVIAACGSFEPAEGSWTLGDFEITEDTCEFPSEEGEGEGEEEAAEESTFSLALTEEGFSITGDGEGAEPVACTLSGKDFTCETNTETTDGGTFVLTVDYSFEGTFSSATETSMILSTDLTCEGDDCPTLEDQLSTKFPCAISSTGAATLNE